MPDTTPTAPDLRAVQAPQPALHSATMWAVHIQGPDDLHACPDRETADALALVLNNQFMRHRQTDDPMMVATVTEWPYGYESWKAESESLRFEAFPAPAAIQAPEGAELCSNCAADGRCLKRQALCAANGAGRAALAAQPQAAPGMVLVPAEPTDDMLNAGKKVQHDGYSKSPRERSGRVYRAMLAAAPQTKEPTNDR